MPALNVVLLSDPDADSRCIYAAVLHHVGLLVIETESAAHALEVADREAISVAVVELLYLPDGRSLPRAFRMRAHSCPLYVVTSEIRVERHMEALASGADAIHLKPFTPSDLVRLVLGSGRL
jgi:DNA-binding response OmpR family regulator